MPWWYYSKKELIVDWFYTIVIIGMVLTLMFMGYFLKVFIQTLKDDKNGKTSKRCELD
jgi:hypothetical protein